MPYIHGSKPGVLLATGGLRGWGTHQRGGLHERIRNLVINASDFESALGEGMERERERERETETETETQTETETETETETDRERTGLHALWC